eukprot:3866347-Alexandrium_andersonii.AAC.1
MSFHAAVPTRAEAIETARAIQRCCAYSVSRRARRCATFWARAMPSFVAGWACFSRSGRLLVSGAAELR